jgi:transposase-like protein
MIGIVTDTASALGQIACGGFFGETGTGERGIDLAHTTILRWVQHYAPEFQKRRHRFARTVGGSWRMDETYVRVKGGWTYARYEAA